MLLTLPQVKQLTSARKTATIPLMIALTTVTMPLTMALERCQWGDLFEMRRVRYRTNMKHDVMAFTTVLKHEATAPIVKVELVVVKVLVGLMVLGGEDVS
jgi:hypothetical protein